MDAPVPLNEMAFPSPPSRPSSPAALDIWSFVTFRTPDRIRRSVRLVIAGMDWQTGTANSAASMMKNAERSAPDEDARWTGPHDSPADGPEQGLDWRDASASSPFPALRADDPASPLVAKLQRLVALNSGEAAALHSLTHDVRRMAVKQVLIAEGSPLDQLPLIVKGLAYCYKVLPCGRRQILGYVIPGDLCGLDFAGRERPDYSVALMSESVVASISTQELSELRASRPSIDRAFSASALVDRAILREWLLNVGQRNAFERLSHFFCELSVRLSSIGLVNEDGSFDLPLNQVALADTTGLTTVHVNRTLQRLRSDGLIILRQRRLTIPDPGRLAELAGFDGEYLNIELSSH